MPARVRVWLRYALAALSAGVVVYLFWPLMGELRGAALLLREARWPWLAAALGMQLAANASLTALNYGLLRSFHGRISFGRLMALLPAIAFIEVAVPSGGASGVVLRARLLRQSGYTLEASTFTLALETLCEVAARVLVLLAGLYYLLYRGEFSLQHGLFLALMLLVAAGGLAGIWALVRKPTRLEPWVVGAVRAWNRLMARLGRRPYPRTTLRARLQVFYLGLAQLRQRPVWPYFLAAAGHISLDVASLGACFLAFGHPLPAATLLTGYSLTLVLSALAALPGGLALTEVSLAVIFSRLGAPGDVAIAAALLYRLMAFWLLRLIGFVSWQVLEAQHDKRSADSRAV